MAEAKSKVLYTRAEPALVAALEREVKRQRKAQPGVKLSQADVIRSLLWDAIKTKAEGRM
jgi:hypothetical protein